MLVLLLSEVSTVEEKVHLDVGILTVIVGVVIPLLTALITKANASSAVKALTTLGLTIFASAVQGIIDVNGVVNTKTFLANFVATFAVAILSYYGFTKHVGTPAVRDIVPEHGLGKAA